MSPCPAEKQGLEISEVSREPFLDFVRRHATSEEIGRIGTCLDGDRNDAPAGELLLLGLMGCSKVCAVICCQIVDAGTGNASAKVCKLDSVVVHSELRKKGLATVLVSKAFAELLDDGRYDLSRYYSHAVHPATVKLLAELGGAIRTRVIAEDEVVVAALGYLGDRPLESEGGEVTGHADRDARPRLRL